MTQGETKSILGVAVRDVTRLRKVAVVVARHGFGEILLRMPFAAQILGRDVAKQGKEAQGTPAERFTQLLGARPARAPPGGEVGGCGIIYLLPRQAALQSRVTPPPPITSRTTTAGPRR